MFGLKKKMQPKRVTNCLLATSHFNEYFCNKLCMDNIENDRSTMIGWYIMGEYSQSKDGKDLLSQNMMEMLEKSIKNEWDDLDSKSKKYLTYDHDSDTLIVTGYPLGVKYYVKELLKENGNAAC